MATLMKEILLSDLLARSLSREAAQPLQRQLYEVIRRGVLDHTLVAGQKLPSSRSLALELGVSRITVSLAYERLIAESYLRAAGGSGTFVSDTGARPRDTRAKTAAVEPWAPLARRGAAISTGRSGLVQHTGAFVPGVADASRFPFHLWRRAVTRHLSKSDLSLAGYAKEGAGYRPLREAIASYLGISRSVVCTADQVIVTAGTHQSIDLCARMLADVGDVAMVEDPCHWAFPSVLAAAGLQVTPGVLDQHGLALAASALPRRTRMVCTSPSHQYPTGAVMPLARRLELLAQARSRKLWVIEDDYDSEFRYDGAPLPSLQGLDRDGHVIYLGTFSKAMFSGMRMSYLVVPPQMAQAFSNACAAIYRSGHLHLQAALADFISEGHFSQHIRRMRLEYAQRQQLLREALARQLGDALALSQARAGLHLYARLTGKVSAQRLVDEAAREGLVLGQPYHLAARPTAEQRAVILGYGAVALEQIEPGVARLAQALERAGTRQTGRRRPG
jgi:GntR family transcriptional regulator/MocR family aminotransferase